MGAFEFRSQNQPTTSGLSKCLLEKDIQPTKADKWIGEKHLHLLNFVLNSLNEEISIDLGEDIEVSTEDIYEILAGASIGGTPVSHIQSITSRTSRSPPVGAESVSVVAG